MWLFSSFAALTAALGEGKGEQATGPASGTIKLWTQLAREPGVVARDKVIQAFKKDNPNVNFEIVLLAGDASQKIQTAAAANTLPDFMHLYDNGTILSFGQMGIVAPVTDVVKELPEDFFLSKKMLQRLYIKNEYWGIPSVTFPSVLFSTGRDWFGQKGLSGAPERHGLSGSRWARGSSRTPTATARSTAGAACSASPKGGRWMRSAAATQTTGGTPRATRPTGKRRARPSTFCASSSTRPAIPGLRRSSTRRSAWRSSRATALTMNTSVSFIYPLMEDKEKGLEWLKKGVAKLASVPMNRPLSEAPDQERATMRCA